jgi:hypothetical protein
MNDTPAYKAGFLAEQKPAFCPILCIPPALSALAIPGRFKPWNEEETLPGPFKVPFPPGFPQGVSICAGFRVFSRKIFPVFSHKFY